MTPRMSFEGRRATRWLIAPAMLLTIALAACSHHDGPSGDQIGKAFALKLPSGIEVSSVDVQVSENDGTKVEPQYETRSKVELEFAEDFYKIVGHLGGKDVVQKTYSDGDDINGTLITSATPKGDDGWNIYFKRVDIPNISGMAKSQFQPNSYVLQDSSDYNDLKEKVAADQKKAQEDAQKQAEAQAQAAKEKADQEARERAANIAKLEGLIKGTWVAKYPAFHNGSMWASGNGRKLGMELTFDDTDSDVGQGTGVLYDYESPAHQVSAPIGFKIDPSGQFATLNFTQDIKLESGVNFSTGPNSQWKLTPDGKLSSNGYNNTWEIQLERNGPALKKFKADVAAYSKYEAQERALILKYNASNATEQFYRLPLQSHTYGLFFVTGDANGGRVYGDGIYGGMSNIAAAAVHAGLLKSGQSGVLRIQNIRVNDRYQYRSTSRNGVTSQQDSGYNTYEMKLVKALPMPPG